MKEEKQQLELIIPEAHEITVGMYQQYAKLFESSEDKTININGNPVLQMKLVSIFCDVDMLVLRSFVNPSDLFESAQIIIDQLKVLHKQVAEQEFEPTFKFGGTEYGFIPNFEKMSAGEFADLTDVVEDWDRLHTAAAIYFRPLTHRKKIAGIEQYWIEDYKGTAETEEYMKQLPVQRLLAVNFLLVNSLNELAQCFQTYLKQEMEPVRKELTNKKELTKEEKELLIQLNRLSTISGDGMSPLLWLPTMTYLESEKQPE